jgi:crotonobetainyl-CoA:carnitine CoA-transferase CaiB-like acyl-CoA transferase
MTAPLVGLRAVELSNALTGAQVGQVLADYGAEVTLVEPPGGSPLRRQSGFPMWSRGKQSIELDLKVPDDVTRARELVAASDVLIESWRPGVAERLGLGYDEASAGNPRLVYASITGFPRTGPFAHAKGYEGLVMAKLGGYWVAQRAVPRPGPAFLASPACSFGASQNALQGILAALHEREHSGAGQRVFANMVLGVGSYDPWNWYTHMFASRYPDAYTPIANISEDGQPNSFMLYCLLVCQTSDGHWLQFSQVMPRLFKAMIEGLGLGWIWDDPRWKTAPHFEDPETRMAFWNLLLGTVKGMTLAEVQKAVDADQNVWAEIFRSGNQLLDHPQLVHDGQVIELDDAERGRVRQLGPFARLSATPASVTQGAPKLGQHSAPLGARGAPGRSGATPSTASAASVSAASTAAAGPPLAGITVLELGSFYAAAYGATMLTDLGARVYKVESLEGEPMRTLLPMPETGSAKVLQGKESIALDLRSPEGREIVLELARRSDLVLCTYRAGVADRLAVGVDDLMAVNPNLFYLEAPGYGIDGPCGSRPAFAPTIGAGTGMAMRNVGPVVGHGIAADVDEVRATSILLNTGNNISFVNCDGIAANGVATSLLLGLLARDRGAGGQRGLASMLNTVGQLLSEDMLEYDGRPAVPKADERLLGYGALYRLYETADGWAFLAAPGAHEWDAVAAALAGTVDLAADERFATAEARHTNDAALAEVLETAFRTRSAAAWERHLLALDVGCMEVSTESPESMMQNDAFGRAHGLVVDVVGPVYDEHPRLRSHSTFSRSTTTEQSGCTHGQHTDAILREIGYDGERIASLRAANVVA